MYHDIYKDNTFVCILNDSRNKIETKSKVTNLHRKNNRTLSTTYFG
ncbi:hypothetical protein HMPREF9442_02803 [Paraprevotella xylaniphila YIT 11841]|uniref:Uncharacterized protein n=1 Tax=Paraprevotella xylaniphila YIT 11841 TaxID=762982 RepID=F3QX69_9BACT|nr:hypothetical protein HMPREF9442_02803 [Paraprevotella xylaniphila YIT 11841]